MKQTHNEDPCSILKSCFARGMFPLMAALFACALAAPSALGGVLVYEGFHPSDYNSVVDNVQMTPSGANVTGDHTVGIATGAWHMNGSIPKVYGTNFGLALPTEMLGKVILVAKFPMEMKVDWVRYYTQSGK